MSDANRPRALPAVDSARAAARGLRALAVPVLCCALALLGLTAWSRSGHAARPSHVTVSQGTVYRPLLGARTTAAFFRIDNTGPTDDTLISVTSPATGPAVLARTVTAHHAGTMRMGGTLPVPAHGTVRMHAYDRDVMVRLRRPPRLGEHIAFVLHFAYAGDVRADAVVIRPGS
ncbi:copper chaperone PCu(A)C [Streptomyces montanisoli]|uniref:Copper chaperone PCu(A)C n=1 Tax=Streptomyces montanisoli TaxID=2798581 RepID=A0A940RVQ7_9ACTN|nr:copper chaperone PCu(A)C [Streptomyces montanisoli]MBP0456323.1 copper chaperone PCu(A)C [Streptomyces montanisoli]